MIEADVQGLAADLSRKIGLRFSAAAGQNEVGEYVDFGLTELDRNEGFSIHVQLGWRSLEISFRPGNYAAQLIGEMGRADSSSRNTFLSLAQRDAADGAVVLLKINGVAFDVGALASWPQNWQTFGLSFRKSPVDVETPDKRLIEVRQWAARFMSLVLALLPVEDAKEELPAELSGFPEGARLTIVVNKYERDRRNRTLCLQAKGYSCSVCGFDFEAKYGDLGRDFIHVHHVTPVSQLGVGYVVNPISDLVPICPNCHAMVHKRNPPLTVEELKAVLHAAYPSAAVHSG